MLFIVKYKGHFKGLFLNIWNAEQYCNSFNKQELEHITIEKVSEADTSLREEIKALEKVDDITHCCGNCARNYYNNNLLFCDFNHEEVGMEDYCVHYI